jgi:hypothetical protein
MTILLEGMSLVFANEVLDNQYPGGILGFRSTWDNGSFCTDGTISRISFFEIDDAFCTLMAMPDFGLDVSTNFAADVAVFLHGGAAWAPCIWLETAKSSDGMWVCWHIEEERGERFAVPPYYRKHPTLARYGNLNEETIMATVARTTSSDGVSLFLDRKTNELLAGPAPLRRH